MEKDLLVKLFVCPSRHNEFDEEKNEKLKEKLVYKTSTRIEQAIEFLKYRGIDYENDQLVKNSKGNKREFWIINCANQKRKEELVQIKIKNDPQDFYDFNGNNCEEYRQICDGWNGFSRRCECGNRRVDWKGDIDFLDGDETYYKLYAEAY